jgi:hypothetical protein
MTKLIQGLVRHALQKILDCWNNGSVVAEEIGGYFCFYVSPFPMVTARQPHAAALPLKSFF